MMNPTADSVTEAPTMLTCKIDGCGRATFHDDPPLCLEHTIEADPNAYIEVSLAEFVAAEDAEVDTAKPRRPRTTTA